MRKETIVLGDGVKMDVARLIASRLFIQGASGSGKTHLVRRIAEQTHGQVQQIILDPEGEYSPLREKFDYVLAAKGGDVPAEPRSAAMLATKLLECGASAIVDLYELKDLDRKRFVQLFIDAMMNSPKALHHPVLIVIDEADKFCPENGGAESLEAVVDLACRGRKRGFCLVLATQRISGVSKRATANCANRLVGLTTEDIDRKRAAQELGITGADAIRALRDLETGDFWAFGPAISRDVVKVPIGAVLTPEPKPGTNYRVKPAKPNAKTLAAMKALADLPAEAEQEARTSADLRKENATLKHQVAAAARHACPKVGIDPKAIEKAGSDGWRRGIADVLPLFQTAQKALRAINNVMTHPDIGQLLRSTVNMQAVTIPPLLSDEPAKIKTPAVQHSDALRNTVQQSVTPAPGGFTPRTKPTVIAPASFDVDKPLSSGARKIAVVLVERRMTQLKRPALALHAGFANSGGFRNLLSELRARGDIEEDSDIVSPSQKLLRDLSDVPQTDPGDPERVIALWKGKLSSGAIKILDHLLSIRNVAQYATRDDTAAAAGFTNSGGFRNLLSELRRGGLLYEQGGNLAVTENIFI